MQVLGTHSSYHVQPDPLRVLEWGYTHQPLDGVDHVAQVPGGTPARYNPVTAPPEWTSLDLENPAFIH
ncbi:MAG: hypothetical protein GXP62_01835 [Oligoflexia bacterium]|nr:hypothetical protein [Oligoflexia bacterium]